MNTGTIKEIIGPVVDVYFEKDRPAIQDALVIEANDKHGKIVKKREGYNPGDEAEIEKDIDAAMK